MKKTMTMVTIGVSVVSVVAAGVVAAKVIDKSKELKKYVKYLEGNLGTETEEERSDLAAFFINKDIFEIENNKIIYKMKVEKCENGVEDKLITLRIYSNDHRFIMRKVFTNKEWDKYIQQNIFKNYNMEKRA